MRKTLMMGTSVLMAFAGFSAASAQDDDVIIVTATKREQTLQEVPVAVSVVDDQVVADAQINDVLDLQTVVPSLRVSQLERANNTTFIIRGLGNGGNNPGIEPSVAVYIDGVFRSRSASALADFLDLERVEVLRGPQSTLFGKNATAGVVNIVTKEPSFTTSGVLEGTIGNYNQFIGRGYVTGPISDSIAYSLSGSYNVRDGYTSNSITGQDINDRNRQSIRGQLLFQPTDALELKLIGDWDQIDEICCTVFNAGEGSLDFMGGPTSGQVIALLGGQKQAPGDWDYDVFFDTASTNEIINNGVSLQADYDLGNDVTFTSITSFRTKEEDIEFEGDFTSLEILGANTRDFDTETFTQEIRLFGETDRFSWLLGGFYFDESAENRINITYGDDTRAYVDILSSGALPTIEGGIGVPVGTFFSSGAGISTFATQDNQQLSIFAQTDINITDRLVLTLGASYYKDEKDVAISSINTNPFSSLDLAEFGFGAFFNAATGLAPTPTNIGTVAMGNPALIQALQAASVTSVADALAAGGVLAPNGVPVDPMTMLPLGNPFLALEALQVLQPSTNFPNSVEDGTSSDEDVPFTVRLAYDVNDRVNVYASYATGFKASSWNLTQDSRPFPSDIAALSGAGLLPSNTSVTLGNYSGTRLAGPEETESIEVGLKAVFDMGSINIAIFDQSIEGFQAQTFQGAGFVLTNAGEQSVRGAEIEANISPMENLDITWAGTFLDPEYDSFPGAQVPTGSAIDLADGSADGSGDLTGATPAGIPDFASSLSAKYTQPMEWGEVFLRADWQYESETQVIDNVPEDVASREVNQFNASLGVNWDGGVELLVWSRNLFNDEYYTTAFPTTLQANSYSAYPNPPRTYGVTLRKRF